MNIQFIVSEDWIERLDRRLNRKTGEETRFKRYLTNNV